MANTFKIAYVVHTAYPDHIGGRENHVHALASSLSRELNIVVLTSGHSKTIQIRSIGNYKLVGLPSLSFKMSSNPLQIYRIMPGLFAALQAEQPDVIHAFEYGSFSTDVAARYCKKYKIPYVLSVYGYQLKNIFLKTAKALYDRTIGKATCAEASRILCPSNTQFQEITRIVGKNNSSKIHLQTHGIDTAAFANVTKNSSLVDVYSLSGKIVLLATVRLLPRKGIKHLLGAIHELVSKHSCAPFKLLIAGPDCGEASNLRALIGQLKIEQYVTFTGPVPHEKIKDLLGLCDIFVLPSLYEGIPLALMEAMAAGKAVIFSNLPCAKMAIRHRHDGLLIDPADKEALAKALYELITDARFRETLGNNARMKSRLFDTDSERLVMRDIYAQLGLKKQQARLT